MFNWKNYCIDTVSHGKVLEPPVFYTPATPAQLEYVEQTIGAKLPSDLSALLLQTNGIKTGSAETGDFLIWDCRHIVQAHIDHMAFLKMGDLMQKASYIFFSDNGCGEHFGYEIDYNTASYSQIGVYYLIENEFRIVTTDMKEWFVGWTSGKLGT